MKLQIIVILLLTVGITAGLAQLGSEQIFITVTSEGKAKVSQSLFPETFVSTVDVKVISENISNLLAIDEENILLGTSQNEDLLKIATLGASSVDLKYNADILSYESGVFRLKYNSNVESRVNLPPLSKLVSLNTIPIEISDGEYTLPPGDISLSFSIRPVTSKEFFVPVENTEYKIETITAAKIEEFSANADEIQFIIKDKAIVLTIIPTEIMTNPNDALLNGEKVDFSQFHKNSTHSWIRIDPHEKGLVKILDTSEKTEEGGGCLIATATYGTEMAPQVQLLREIRDNQLMNTNSGVSFMTGFNSFYYSFSPHVADLQRENQLFKEIVKIGITPLLSSLFVMEYAETDEEILGLGISVILMNIGMYFVFPFVICYQGMRILRTKGVKKSNWSVISNCNYNSVLKIGLLGLIALFVLTVSLPSAFAQTDSESESPLRMVLDITYENIVESITDSGLDQEEITVRLIQVDEEYQEAVDLINGDDVVAAKQNVVQTMAFFELQAEEISESSPTPGQLTPGFGAGIGSASDSGIENGQGLGVGGVPPGIFKQISAANTFAVSEAITSIDEEVGQYRELAKLNNLEGIDFGEFDESVNLAKTLLANGVVPDAQVKLELANQIKDDLLQKIQDAANENSAVLIEEYVEEQKNLGQTKKDIRELEEILEDITTDNNEETGDGETPEDGVNEAPGNSANAPGQNKADSGDEAPGNSANAPGQNKENDNTEDNKFESPEDIPGFDSASDIGKANGQGNGLGLGSIPPGLAKLFGTDEGEILEDLPPGLANIPPGQAKKFEDYSASFEQSMDDFYENSYEAQIDDVFEMNFDGTNKGNGDGKGKMGAYPGKSGEAPGKIKAATKEGGNPNCGTKGITDGNSTASLIVGQEHFIDDFTAIGNNCKDISSQIKFNLIAPNGTVYFGSNANVFQGTQPDSFTPDVNGSWEIQTKVQSFRLDRVMTATGGDEIPTVTGGGIPDDSTGEGVDYVINVAAYFDDVEDLDSEMTYTGTDSKVSGQGNLVNAITSDGNTTITVDVNAGKTGVYDITIRATDTAGGFVEDTFRLTVS
ncbi:Ig domain-containing protein [Nitrosopumilus cobalaminigenes]|uniref:Ig domain-containing protein n=1 Tax=Nitrosopumilus cobalaminigenes TaxID=1470066 RepID=UPI0031B5EE81